MIEQIGVIPDIKVDNLPLATFHEEDTKIDTKIKHMLVSIRKYLKDVTRSPCFIGVSERQER